LVDLGADVNNREDDHGVGPLGWACTLQDVQKEVAEFLISEGATADIFSAIALGRQDVVGTLIQEDSGVLEAEMSGNEFRRRPLHFAVEKRQLEMARILLEAGADPTDRDDCGAPPLALLRTRKFGISESPTESVKLKFIDLFRGHGFEPDLFTTVMLEAFDAAGPMLATDPSAILPGGRDQMLLHCVTLHNLPAAVEWLLANGADVDAKQVVWDCDFTPMHGVANHGLMGAAKALLKANPDLSSTDGSYNSTPMGWAGHCGHPEIGDLIEHHLAAR